MVDAMNQEWWKKASDVVNAFHKEKAAIPSNAQRAREDLKENIAFLRTYLEFNYNLCDKVVFSGSAYEDLNISGDNIEFDVMLIAQRSNFLYLTECNNGVCKIRSNSPFLNYPFDEDFNIDSEKYRSFFFGLIQKWSNMMMTHKKKSFTLVNHGVATQMNVNDEKGILWYQVDLVPCFEAKSSLISEEKFYCVPKPIPNQRLYWRLSYSIDETQIAKKLSNDAKKCIRIIKALFKLETNGLFTKFTSYHIKTSAFYLKERGNWPNEENLGRSIYDFLVFIKESLKNGELKHFFDRTINLLDKIEVSTEQLANTINGWLKNEQKFLTKFSSSIDANIKQLAIK
ncbi:cyclic GMP-AMP synthase-like receptor [Hydra vulgaris]|uniref:Cyclic GMP-AMP synthase-like receptor n=1 Tax=Hydra vulgaris TaxID=6087 RepID=CGLR_HYDVU|nr:uncharacterized protein LOC101234795 [Hydra vulgaris]